jgi:hypothetical protein
VLDIRDRLIQVHEHYDLILAFDERVLRECSNAVFLTESACSWLPRKWNAIDPIGYMNYGGGLVHKNPVVMSYEPCDVSAKKFAVSFLTSSKNSSQGHKLRQEIYERLPEHLGDLTVWKHRSPPIVADKRTILEPYQYSIVPENSRHSGYYTEKIMDCFIAKTIPVYWGCTDIGKHFNVEGIVQFTDCDDLLTKLNTLTPEFYQDKHLAVEENFHKALLGVHQWDQIENHITEGIRKKHEKDSDAEPCSGNRYSQQVSRPLRRFNRKP